MAARIASSMRLVARMASTGITSRVQASRAFAPSFTASRLLSTSSPFFNEDRPTLAEEEVRADQAMAHDESSSKTSQALAEEEGRTVFVGGLSWNLDNDWLKEEVEKVLEISEGITSVRIARDHMGRSKGFGFVEFDSPELADAATRINVEIDGRTAEFRLATPSPARPERTGGDRPMRERRDPSEGARNSPNSTVWVGNVAWTAEESEIEECFAQYGDVLRVSLPRDRETGRSRGIAYVEFAKLQDAEAVVANGLSGDGIELEGRALRLDFAEKPSENSRGSGGARGGRGGMRGGGRGGFGGGERRSFGGDREGGERRSFGGDRGGGGGGRGGGSRDGGRGGSQFGSRTGSY